MACSRIAMALLALIALIGTSLAFPIVDEFGEIFAEIDDGEMTPLSMDAEVEEEVLVCSLENEKNGSWDCIWDTELVPDEANGIIIVEDLPQKRKCNRACWKRDAKQYCGMKCSF